jgi:hypothetical protein
MRRLLMVGMVSLAAAACGPSRAEVEVDWTFGGLSCADAGVEDIQFAIAGEVLSPDHFSCAQAPVGASLGSFVNGDYQLTVSGLDPAGNLLYQTTQTVQVRGTRLNQFPVDVQAVAPTSPDSASANLTWTFSNPTQASLDCAAAGVTQVQIFVDPGPDGFGGIDAGTVACSTNGIQGASVDGLTEGTHSFAILGIDAGHLLYRTHNPPSAAFRLGLTTDLAVSAESPP